MRNFCCFVVRSFVCLLFRFLFFCFPPSIVSFVSRARVLNAMTQQGLLATRAQPQRHALVKPSAPVVHESHVPEYSSSSEDEVCDWERDGFH
jgi:hypothetical protein